MWDNDRLAISFAIDGVNHLLLLAHEHKERKANEAQQEDFDACTFHFLLPPIARPMRPPTMAARMGIVGSMLAFWTRWTDTEGDCCVGARASCRPIRAHVSSYERR